MTRALLVIAILMGGAMSSGAAADGWRQSQPPRPMVLAQGGWWTKCWTILNGTTYIDTRAQNSKQCHASLKRCTGNDNITSHFRTSAVLQGTKRITKCR